MDNLKLTLCRKWFDMILQGEKTEEYRDIKTFWTRRFMRSEDVDSVFFPDYWEGAVTALLNDTVERDFFDIEFRKFDAVEFYRGAPYYGKELPRLTIKLEGIHTGFGRPELGAPKDRRVFILRLGAISETHNCQTLLQSNLLTNRL